MIAFQSSGDEMIDFFFEIQDSTASPLQFLLQVGQLSLNQSRPCTLLPPILHAIDPLPKCLLIYSVDLILASIERSSFPASYVQCCLVFATNCSQ